jgi:hypothetical protein
MKKTLYEISVLIGIMMLGLICINTCNRLLKPDTSHMTPQEKHVVDSTWEVKEAQEFKDFADELD